MVKGSPLHLRPVDLLSWNFLRSDETRQRPVFLQGKQGIATESFRSETMKS
jgi:hypothetical protein